MTDDFTTSRGALGGTVATLKGAFLAAVGLLTTAGGALSSLLWAVFQPLLAPLDRVLQPVANLYNRTLGQYLGEVSGLQFAMLSVGFLAILTGPFWGNARALALGCIWAIFAMAWDIQSGYTGYISFGHSALAGMGGYTVGMLGYNLEAVNQVVYLGQNAPVVHIALALAVLTTLILGLLIAMISLRLRGPYFSLVTLVAVLLFMRLIRGFNQYTNGENGISGFQHGLQPFSLGDPIARYYWMAIPMLLVAAVLLVIARSNVGLILTGIRENEAAVSAAGISPTKFKVTSFVISSIPMGLAGAMLAYFQGSVSQQSHVMVDNSIEIIAMAVIGGMASILGPLFGAMSLIYVEDRILHALFEPGMRGLVLWSLILVVFLVARDGIFRRIWHGLGAVRGDSE